jgi:transposase
MLPESVRILVCTQPQDMRRSFDTLSQVVRQFGEEPQSGALYVFVGRRPTRVKVLWWDRNGFCLLYKRLHQALFAMPTGRGATVPINAKALAELLAGVAKEESSKKSHSLH